MAKRTQKKRKGLVFKTSSGTVLVKWPSNNTRRSSAATLGFRKRRSISVVQGNTVHIIRAVDKIYNQETSDIERLARIYSVKE